MEREKRELYSIFSKTRDHFIIIIIISFVTIIKIISQFTQTVIYYLERTRQKKYLKRVKRTYSQAGFLSEVTTAFTCK
jgi:hypothetical protein